MLTLAERGGEESGVEVRPEGVLGLPLSAGMPSAGTPEPVVGRQAGANPCPTAENPCLRRHEGSIPGSKTGMGPVHLGNVRSPSRPSTALPGGPASGDEFRPARLPLAIAAKPYDVQSLREGSAWLLELDERCLDFGHGIAGDGAGHVEGPPSVNALLLIGRRSKPWNRGVLTGDSLQFLVRACLEGLYRGSYEGRA